MGFTGGSLALMGSAPNIGLIAYGPYGLFRVWDLGFGVWGLGFGVLGSGFWVLGLGFGVGGLGFTGLGFRV